MAFFGIGPKPQRRSSTARYLLDDQGRRRRAGGLPAGYDPATATEEDKNRLGLKPPIEQPALDDGGGPGLGGTDPPDALMDLQSAFDAAGAAGIRTRKRAAAGSRRTLINTPNAAQPSFRRRTLLGY